MGRYHHELDSRMARIGMHRPNMRFFAYVRIIFLCSLRGYELIRFGTQLLRHDHGLTLT